MPVELTVTTFELLVLYVNLPFPTRLVPKEKALPLFTFLYVLAVYTSAVNIKNSKDARWIGLTCDFVAIICAVWLCRIL